MLQRIPHWTAQLTDAGMMLSPATGAPGTVFYADRVRPLTGVPAILRDVERRFPSPRPRKLVALDPLITDEGEHAAIATLADRTGDTRIVGIVFGDDFYALCVGFPRRAEDHAELDRRVRSFVATDIQTLGVRRRRFVYTPPLGWQGQLTEPFHAAWYPLDFPANPSCLIVDPATPIPSEGALERWMLDTLTAGVDGDLTVLDTREATSPSGLSGVWLTAAVYTRAGAEVAYEHVVLRDDRFVYPLLLQSPPDRRAANANLIRAVVQSVVPVPRPRAQPAPASRILAWMVD